VVKVRQIFTKKEEKLLMEKQDALKQKDLEYLQQKLVFESQAKRFAAFESEREALIKKIKEQQDGIRSLETVVLSEDYYLTNVDIWLLVSKYQIPCMFLSSQTFVETKYERTEMIAYGERTDSFVYILCPRLQAGRIPVYKWVQRKEETRFPLSIFVKEDCIGSLAEAIDKRMDVYNYIKQFTVTKKTAPRRKKLTLVDDEEVVV
jgi:hypothetical protein